MEKVRLSQDILEKMIESAKPKEGTLIEIKFTPEKNIDSYLNHYNTVITVTTARSVDHNAGSRTGNTANILFLHIADSFNRGNFC